MGVGRIAEAFSAAAEERRPALIPYLTAGDPSLAVSAALVPALERGGADLIELGVPFSDPMADGAVNQRAAQRSLEAGTTLAGLLGMVATTRRGGSSSPIVLFTYLNPILAYGLERFAEQAAASRVDGVLCLDLPPEEAGREYLPALREHGLAPIFLLAPTSTMERIRLVGEVAEGFVYLVSRTGVTGEREALEADLKEQLRRVKKSIQLPVAVGFGISTPEQAAEVGRRADGVVVGSALVHMLEEAGEGADLAGVLETRVREFSEALAECRSGRLAGWLGRG